MRSPKIRVTLDNGVTAWIPENARLTTEMNSELAEATTALERATGLKIKYVHVNDDTSKPTQVHALNIAFDTNEYLK